MIKRLFVFLGQWLRRIEVNRAVFFGIMGRLWSAIASPIIILFIALRFTPFLQGYYYTFWSLLALQVFVEMGLGTVTIQFASHEWSKLRLDQDGYVVGEKEALSRLISLAHMMVKWYICGGVIATIGLSVGGYFFFSRSAEAINIAWFFPWLILCALTGVNICLIPMWSILEGCNQVANIYTYRFFLGLLNSFAVCLAILLGAGLWAVSVSVLVTVTCSLLFFGIKYGNFFKSIIFTNIPGMRMKWRKEIFPMQWRMAGSFISGYFAFSLFVPVLFKFHGPVVAGQMGMTWSVIGFMGTIPSAWLIPKVPQFGMLIAQKDYKELDRVFYRITRIFVVVTLILAVSVWCLVYLLNILKLPIASRLISPVPTAIFLLAQVVIMFSTPLSVYLRAHKKEPLFFVSVITGFLIGLSTIMLGKPYSVMGIAVGYFLATLIILPVVVITWFRCREQWHNKETYITKENKYDGFQEGAEGGELSYL
jgi:hypothetical protein